jgi:hypothetical protein
MLHNMGFIIVLFAKCYSAEQIKDDYKGEACSTHEGACEMSTIELLFFKVSMVILCFITTALT